MGEISFAKLIGCTTPNSVTVTFTVAFNPPASVAVMVASPSPSGVTMPLASIATTFAGVAEYFTARLTSANLPPSVAEATSCCRLCLPFNSNAFAPLPTCAVKSSALGFAATVSTPTASPKAIKLPIFFISL